MISGLAQVGQERQVTLNGSEVAGFAGGNSQSIDQSRQGAFGMAT